MLHNMAPSNDQSKSKEIDFDESTLDFIQLRKDFNSIEVETKKEKLMRKISENPMVPLGNYQKI